jgi:hypothetical protein
MNLGGMPISDSSQGWPVDVGSRVVLLPSGWRYVPRSGFIFCGNHELKQEIMLFLHPAPNSAEPESWEFEGEQVTIGIFSGRRRDGEVKVSVLDRFLFAARPHCRFEWVLQNDVCGLLAIYIAESNEDRQHIRQTVEKFLSEIRIAA